MSKYGILDPGTHVPVLNAITEVFKIDSALEFGSGIWSTFILTKNCKKVTSIEYDKIWANYVENEYSHRRNLNVIVRELPTYKFLDDIKENFDLIFVDDIDHNEHRRFCLEKSFYRAPFIVIHDTHSTTMGWEKCIIPQQYSIITYIGLLPFHTTVLYLTESDFEKQILNINNYELDLNCIDSNFWTKDFNPFHPR
jgi:hypothetical protein